MTSPQLHRLHGVLDTGERLLWSPDIVLMGFQAGHVVETSFQVHQIGLEEIGVLDLKICMSILSCHLRPAQHLPRRTFRRSYLFLRLGSTFLD